MKEERGTPHVFLTTKLADVREVDIAIEFEVVVGGGVCGEGTGVDAVFGKVGAVLVLVGVLLDYIVGLLRSRKWLGGCSMLSYLLSAH